MLSACVVNKPITLKKGDIYSIKPEELTSPMASFSVPDGYWSISKVTLKTLNRGWFNIDGRPPKSPVGYSIKFSITPEKRYGEDMREVLKTHNFDEFVQKQLQKMTPQLLKEMDAINSGGKIIYLNQYKCRITWYQQKIAPLAYDGRGIVKFTSFMICPLVIDGEINIFSISIDSSIDPKFYGWQAEYNKNKRPEDPEVTIDTYEHLTTLGEKVLVMFNDIKIHGKVSQNYEDIADK
jgi:hypothetical protein